MVLADDGGVSLMATSWEVRKTQYAGGIDWEYPEGYDKDVVLPKSIIDLDGDQSLEEQINENWSWN